MLLRLSGEQHGRNPVVTHTVLVMTILEGTNEPRQANLCLRAFRHDKF